MSSILSVEFGNFSELSEVRFLFLLKCVVLLESRRRRKISARRDSTFFHSVLVFNFNVFHLKTFTANSSAATNCLLAAFNHFSHQFESAIKPLR